MKKNYTKRVFYIVFYYLWSSEGLLTDSANHPEVGNVLPLGFFNKYIDMKVEVKDTKPILLSHINGQSEFDMGARRIENENLAEQYFNQTFNTQAK